VRSGMLEAAVRPLQRRISGLILRGVVRLVKDSPGVQQLQLSLLAGETTPDSVEHVQPYGFTSVPQVGAEPAIALFPQGERSHAIVLVVGDRRYRLRDLSAGEVALFDDQDQKLVLGRDEIRLEDKHGNTIVLDAAGVTVTSSGTVNVNASGAVNLGGPGGAGVARIGDRVNVGSGSSAGLWPIVEGSSQVKAT